MSEDLGDATSAPLHNVGLSEISTHVYASPRLPSIEQELFENGADFDFFQAVAVLEAIYPDRRSLCCDSKKRKLPLVKFVADSASSAFAASAVQQVNPATTAQPTARMVVNFMGLTGPSGILPAVYTDLLARVEFEGRGAQKYALRDWFDLFNHRLVTLFYRAWKKYRPYACYRDLLKAREQLADVDTFTAVLRSVCGFGLPAQAKQMARFMPGTSTCSVPQPSKPSRAFEDGVDPGATHGSPQANPPQSEGLPSTRSSLLRYAGLLAQRPRCAANLQAVLSDFFSLPIRVDEFCGNWLTIDETAQSRLGVEQGNCRLGVDAVVGDQVWERQNRIVIRVGTLQQADFLQLLPDHPAAEAGEKNKYAQMCDIVRLFVGPECDFELQLVLDGGAIPECCLDEKPSHGLRLGWNAWLPTTERPSSVDDTLLACI